MTAPAARMVKTAQVRSGHFGSWPTSAWSSDIRWLPAPFSGVLAETDTSVGGSLDEGAQSNVSFSGELRMPLNSRNARESCTQKR